MWYRLTINKEDESSQIADKISNLAVKIWLDSENTPNRHDVFSRNITKSLLNNLSKWLNLNDSDPEGIYENLKNKAESYASLMYRELGMRYYILLSQLRSDGKLDNKQFDSMIKKEVFEATLDLIGQIVSDNKSEINKASIPTPPEIRSLPTPQYGFDFPLAEKIDLSESDSNTYNLRIKKLNG